MHIKVKIIVLLAVFMLKGIAIAGETEYVYKGDNYPDPFLPVKSGAVKVTGDHESVLDINSSVYLKAVLSSPKGRMAIINTPDGASFMAKDGRVFDQSRKVVNDISSIVKDKSVVLITRDKHVHELFLPGYEPGGNK